MIKQIEHLFIHLQLRIYTLYKLLSWAILTSFRQPYVENVHFEPLVETSSKWVKLDIILKEFYSTHIILVLQRLGECFLKHGAWIET